MTTDAEDQSQEDTAQKCVCCILKQVIQAQVSVRMKSLLVAVIFRVIVVLVYKTGH